MDDEAVVLLAELLTDELTTGFAMWGERHGLPLIHWVCRLPLNGRSDLLVGMPTNFYEDTERCAQVALWAESLGGFELYEDIQPGCVGYVGDIGGIDATILAVNDRDTFDFWQQVTGPDEPVPEEEITPVRSTDYQPWPDMDLSGLDESRALLRFIDIAVTRAFNAWATTQDLPPMTWITNTPHYGGREEILLGTPAADANVGQGIEHARRWAGALGLRQRYQSAGLVKYSGVFAGLPVAITAVTCKTTKRTSDNP